MSRRVAQDKSNAKEEFNHKCGLALNLTRSRMTVEMMQESAKLGSLSNDKVMKLGEDRLEKQVKLTEIYVQKFWKEIKFPRGQHRSDS